MDRRTFLGGVGVAAGVLLLPRPGMVSAQTTALVTSLSQLQSAINSATAGTTITLANGSYAVGSPITISGRNGTSTAPITIQAETRGGVTLTGSQTFVFSKSSWITISGFNFRQSISLDLAADSSRLRLTRNDFQLASSVGHSVVVRGNDVKIDRNVFHDKSTAGCYLVIDGPSGDATAAKSMAQRTYILRNYLYGDRKSVV